MTREEDYQMRLKIIEDIRKNRTPENSRQRLIDCGVLLEDWALNPVYEGIFDSPPSK